VADQRIELVEHDAEWARRFTVAAARLTEVLAPWLAAPVEHIGSTSVPGLRAKPIIDMLAPVTTLDARQAMVRALTAAGWLYWPDDPNGARRLWLLRPRPEARTHHLQVVAADDPAVAALLAFREALRADAELCRRYAELKQDLAARFPHEREAYTNAKTDFITAALRAVGVTPPERHRLPE
jgi:GrpB-like predicted nucleotidyltransferase (UPF0157 family)